MLQNITTTTLARNLHFTQGIAILLTIVLLAACSSPTLNQPPVTPAPNPNPIAAKPIGEAKVGAYIKGAAWDKNILYALEAEIGHEFNIIQWYTSWDAPFEDYLVTRVLSLGRLPLITWQARTQSLDDIIAGSYDSYIRSWARGIKACEGDVYLRPFPEMNGDWTPWHGNPEKLVKAWRHVVDVFRNEGTYNARWVWSPNVTDEPRIDSNRMELYYPGDDYVDVLALDGYNWGDTRQWSDWTSFEDIFRDPYARITALGDQPIWLAEIASTEIGGDKGSWIRDMLNSTAFPRIDAIVWFNEHKETDWRIQSSEKSINAFKEWFSERNQAAVQMADAHVQALR